MDASTLFNVLALAISLVALAVSGVLAVGQTRAMRQANALPVLMELRREFGSPEMRAAETAMLDELAGRVDPSQGFHGLSAPDDAIVSRVYSSYSVLATLVAERIISERTVRGMYGYRLRRVWPALFPFVQGERTVRGDELFGAYLEDLYCRVRNARSPDPRTRLRKLGTSTAADRDQQ